MAAPVDTVSAAHYNWRFPVGYPWSFSLSATQVFFAVYVLLETGYYQIVGFPTHYKKQLEESVSKFSEIQLEKSTIIPVRYIKWYNIFAVIVTLQISAIFGSLVAVIRGKNWLEGGLKGILYSALILIPLVYTQEFVIVGLRKTITNWLEKLLGALDIK